MNTFAQIVQQFASYSLDGSADKDIASLVQLGVEDRRFDSPTEPVDRAKELMVVLVEERLFANLPGSKYSANDLKDRLATLHRDLTAERWQPKFVRIAVGGGLAKDGQRLLAIREFFKAVRASFPNFTGALLVGSFPHAAVVRTWPQDCGDGEYRVGMTPGAPRPFDIVLGDLSGNWRALYRPSVGISGYSFKTKATTQVTKVGSKVKLVDPDIVKTSATHKDVFWLGDAKYSISHPPNGAATVELDLVCANPEIGPEDSGLPNPVARPDIAVSRIDARCVAVQPPDPRLVQNGRPVAVPSTPKINLTMEAWTRDPALERTLLVDYFDRNHAFRTPRIAGGKHRLGLGVIEHNLGTAAINEGLWGLNMTREPDTTSARLLDFARWLKRPLAIRGVAAHADWHSTFFRYDAQTDAVDSSVLEQECGGRPWRWIEESGQYVPSFRGHSTGDLYLYRTLWENKVLANASQSVMIHVGCDVSTVSYNETQHDSPLYGVFQNAASLLFYTNQVAILCRTTWWNRGPLDFGKGFNAANDVVGDGWREMFDHVAYDAALGLQSTERKQSYIWNLLGDFTLRKSYARAIPPLDVHRWQTIDLLSLLLRDDVYVRLQLPDPGPDDAFIREVRKEVESLTKEAKAEAEARARHLSRYVSAVGKELADAAKSESPAETS